ncbi:MAG TPA: peptidoglycan recognition family protein [Lachnospiraceae bacterium]|nr:peptidoglycan recognition family protein [Lachnospiraceae bacterium]
MNPYLEQSRILTESDYAQQKRELRERLRHEHLKKLRRKRLRRKLIVVFLLSMTAILLLVWTITLILPSRGTFASWEESIGMLPNDTERSAWIVDYLTPNEYSRPGDVLNEVNSIFVHYTANPGTSAAQNRSYFEQLKDTHERSASAHFVIGCEGEIIQCIPLDEIAYAVQTRNNDSISIECCYVDENGSFTQKTYKSLLSLITYLLNYYNLDTEDVLRHYDCGGKKCPLYYVENEDKWEQLKIDVEEKRKE